MTNTRQVWQLSDGAQVCREVFQDMSQDWVKIAVMNSFSVLFSEIFLCFLSCDWSRRRLKD